MANIEHDVAHSQKVMPLLRATDIEMGNQISLVPAGVWVESYSKANDKNSLIPSIEFDDNTAATECKAPFATQLLLQQLINSDESGEFVGTNKIFYQSTPESSIAQKYYFKGGSVTATQDVRVEFYRGTSAGDIIAANKIFDGLIPFGDWPTAGVEAGFNLVDIAQNDFLGVEHVGFQQGVGTIAVFSSGANFSMKTNAGQDQIWYKVDFHVLSEKILLDKYTTRAPHADISYATGSLPLVTGENVLSSLILGDKIEYSIVGGRVQYDGSEDLKVDFVFDFSGVSNTVNLELIPKSRIYLAEGGTVDIQGTPREFDGANEGAVASTRSYTLSPGDQVEVIFDASKDAPLFALNSFSLLFRKVS